MTERAIPETLIGLVNRYSPSGEEDEAVAYLVDRMASLGYDQSMVDPVGNAVGVMGSGSRQIVLLGHIDTVPGEIPVQVQNDILYGRGAVDAKGPLAAFVDAVAAVGPVPGWQFVVIGAVDEERDSKGARYLAGQYRPDFAVIGEPNRWSRVALGYKGSASAQISVRRPVAHSAGRGKSACEAVVEAWNAIGTWVDRFNTGRNMIFDQVLPSLHSMHSGKDGLEEWADLQIGVRLPLDLSPEAWYSQMESILIEVESARVSLRPTGFPTSAYRAEKNTSLVRAFLGGIRAAGGKPGFVVKTGTADLNIVAPVWGCPAVAYGPGDSGLDHTPNEHILLAEYQQAVEVLVYVLRNLNPRQPGRGHRGRDV